MIEQKSKRIKKKLPRKTTTPKKNRKLDLLVQQALPDSKDHQKVRRSERNKGKNISYNYFTRPKRQGSLERKIGWDQVETADVLPNKPMTDYITSPEFKSKYTFTLNPASKRTSKRTSKLTSPSSEIGRAHV